MRTCSSTPANPYVSAGQLGSTCLAVDRHSICFLAFFPTAVTPCPSWSQPAAAHAHQVPPFAGARLGGVMLITTTVALRAVPLFRGALAAGVTNGSMLLAGDAAPLRPTTVTSYLQREKEQERWAKWGRQAVNSAHAEACCATAAASLVVHLPLLSSRTATSVCALTVLRASGR